MLRRHSGNIKLFLFASRSSLSAEAEDYHANTGGRRLAQGRAVSSS